MVRLLLLVMVVVPVERVHHGDDGWLAVNSLAHAIRREQYDVGVIIILLCYSFAVLTRRFMCSRVKRPRRCGSYGGGGGNSDRATVVQAAVHTSSHMTGTRAHAQTLARARPGEG